MGELTTMTPFEAVISLAMICILMALFMLGIYKLNKENSMMIIRELQELDKQQ